MRPIMRKVLETTRKKLMALHAVYRGAAGAARAERRSDGDRPDLLRQRQAANGGLVTWRGRECDCETGLALTAAVH